MTDRPTGPATAAGRRVLLQDYRGNESYTVTRADILAIEDEATEAVMADCQETATSEYERGQAETKARILAALPEALQMLWRVRDAQGDFVWNLPVPPNERTAAALAAAIEKVLDG